MKYTIIDQKTETYKFAEPYQIREALERWKVAETKTDDLGNLNDFAACFLLE